MDELRPAGQTKGQEGETHRQWKQRQVSWEEKEGQRKWTPLLNMTGKLVTVDEEKGVLKFSTSVFTGNVASPLEWMDHKTGTGRAKTLPL